MTEEEIGQKYLSQANQLEVEFFDIVDEGLPSQHRVLKAGKFEANFILAHGNIWRGCETELIAEGFKAIPMEPELPRDLEAEIDELKARLEVLELVKVK